MFHHYRKLVQLRSDLPVVVHGTFTLLLPDHEQVFAYTRTMEDAALLVLANFSSSPVEVTASALPDLTGATVLLATPPGADGLSLSPWESRIYQLSVAPAS